MSMSNLINEIPTENNFGNNQPLTNKKTLKRRNKDDNDDLQNDMKLPELNKITKQLDGFVLHIQGIIESASLFSGEAVYVKYEIVHSIDWIPIKGKNSGESQLSTPSGRGNILVWNFPFEFSVKSYNPSGWPQFTVCCSGPDFLGREVIKAYGVCYIPTTPGVHTRNLKLFSPISSSSFIDCVGRIFFGQKAEIINNPKVLSTGIGREVMKTKSEGTMNIRFNIQLTDMQEFGYNL